MQALIDAPDLGARIRIVASDRPRAQALDRARAAGIPNRVVDWRDHRDRDRFSSSLGEVLEEARVEAVVLAGFMRILGRQLVDRYRHRILNIHPSLLPSFPGADAVGQALRHGVKLTGVTVHFVDEEVDHGPIIAQEAVPVLPDDDEASLHARIQVQEHSLYPRVVSALAAGRLDVVGRKVVWS